MSTQAQVEIGSDFLGYRIEELVGRGRMGVVYRAYDLRLKRTVALKLVTPELALDERFKERFARETELTMALEHPNVVPIHDAGDVDGRLYLAMRLVEGTDLRALLAREGALEPARALAICGQVARAPRCGAPQGPRPRDVKPSNVLLDANEHVYLADFGLTRRLEEQGAVAGDGRSVGTPPTSAPSRSKEDRSTDGLTSMRSAASSTSASPARCPTVAPRDFRLAPPHALPKLARSRSFASATAVIPSASSSRDGARSSLRAQAEIAPAKQKIRNHVEPPIYPLRGAVHDTAHPRTSDRFARLDRAHLHAQCSDGANRARGEDGQPLSHR